MYKFKRACGAEEYIQILKQAPPPMVAWGMLVPLLQEHCVERFMKVMNPVVILVKHCHSASCTGFAGQAGDFQSLICSFNPDGE